DSQHTHKFGRTVRSTRGDFGEIMNRFFLLLAIVPVLLGQNSKIRFEELVHNFDYDRNAPLDLKEAGEEDRGGVAVHDISYTSPRGGGVPAYLSVPAGQESA